ncbi:EAL domain-containing protein [Clostridium aminobutyricum]|uniref:EAL domain-containing protein n=1 Tax=Clostridium aminobutyricum TaxID=33953 RepID=A0A939IHU5_CLOAM|nr:EAL domain-containing protein [Clostridium aminobutyricum]MBN7771824.1 EAL domain-containing protein [Clostridium aminobutyricum]
MGYKSKKFEYKALNSFLNTVPGGIGVYELSDKIKTIYANDGLCALFGYSREAYHKLIAQDSTVVIHPRDLEGLKKQLDICIKEKRRVKYSFRAKKRDGNWGWILIQGSQIGDNEGRPIFVAMVIDISKEKDVERELQLSEERFKFAFSQTSAQIMEYDIKTKEVITYDSKDADSRIYRVDDDVPQSYFDNGIIHAHFIDDCSEMFRKIDEGQKNVTKTIKMKQKDGEYHWMKLSYTNIYDEDGKPYKAIGIAENIETIMDIQIQANMAQQYRAAITSDAIIAMDCDLAEDRLVKCDTNVNGFIKLNNMESYTEAIEFVSDKSADAAQKAEFIHRFSRINLLSYFIDGKNEVYFEHQNKDENGELIWIGTTVNMFRHSETGNVCAILHIKNIDERKKYEVSLKAIAERDSLTALYNRNAMENIVKAAMEEGQRGRAAFFMLDIDNFKELNDTYGHMYGDQVLKMVADKLKSTFRTNDIIARMGGDEFAVFIQHIPSDEFINSMAMELCRRLYIKISEGNTSQNISCSLGIAFSPDNGADFLALYNNADMALYYAKGNGKNQYAVCKRAPKRKMTEIRPNSEDIVTHKFKLDCRKEYDRLTNIFNRESFYKETKKMLEENPDITYILIRGNIERFKLINDLFGTEVGDRVLRGIGEELTSRLKDKGTYGRLVSDNFVMCFPYKKLDITGLMENCESLFASFKLNYNIQACFGMYIITDITIPVDLMCDRAGLAMQTVKGNYMKRYAFYDNNLRDTILEEQEIISEMNQALESGEFHIFLQPVYSAVTGTPMSAESLVRWFHPKKGIISPTKFIPLFEKNGFIMKLDLYVWECACRQLRKWKDEGHDMMPISVNISRVNFFNPNLCDELIGLVKKYDLEPELLELEITESAYTDNPEQLAQTIKVLQAYGFPILMDDFGSGYSSLNMLKDLPVDVLKIDLKFLSDFEKSTRAGSILISVVRMANWLDIPVIAEGVETKSQLDFLTNIGCDRIQGYYLAKPVATSEFDNLM